MDEDFYNKKWGASCEKKAGGLSGAAARTCKLKKIGVCKI